MEELKPILIKPIVKKYYDKLKTNEQRLEFLENLLFRGMDGQEPQIEDEIVELALMPCLDSIRECRENYNRRQAKNAEYGIQGKEHGIEGKDYGIQGKEYGILGKEYGILGKEYGIQGKEYGILGKEYGKLGGRPRKRPDVFAKIYSFIMSDENYLKSALSEDKTQNRMLRRNIKARIPEVSENNDENSKLINGVIKKIKEENNNNNGDNKVQ